MRDPGKPDGWYCHAKAKQSGNPCEKRAGWGTDHPGFGLCRFHGGSSPAGKRNAEHQAAEHAVATYGLPVDTDPHTALLDELKRTLGHVLWLESLIGQLGHASQDGNITSSELKQYQHLEDGGTIERPAIWIELYHRERKMLREVAKTCADVGVEERRVQLVEAQAAEVVAGFQRFAIALGHDIHSDEVRAAFRTALTPAIDATSTALAA